MRTSGADVVRQLKQSGALLHAPGALEVEAYSVRGRTGLLMVVQLRRDSRFAEGTLHRLHADVGTNLTDFRSHRGAFGKGSLQIVVDLTTGQFYADVDLFSPYTDLVNFMGHTGEVIAGWWRKRKPRSESI